MKNKWKNDSGAGSEPLELREAPVEFAPSVVSVREAKSKLSALLEWVSTGKEIMITSDGKPKARLVPISTEPKRKVFRGMGRFLSAQPVDKGPTADELIREDRDSREG